MIHELATADLRHSWFEDADGYMVSDWEVATRWDQSGRPIAWRRLRTEEAADARVLSHLLHAAARTLRLRLGPEAA